MTMLAYTINPILELIPEALPLVKQASVQEEFPLNNKDSCLASALKLSYLQNIDYSPVEFTKCAEINNAVTLFGLQNTLRDLSAKMIKQSKEKRLAASRDHNQEYMVKESSFETGGIKSIAEHTATASALYKEAKALNIEPSDQVKLYSGHAYLHKEAAIKSLTVRYHQTKDDYFVKVAKVIGESQNDPRLKDPEALTKLASVVYNADYSRGLHFKGFNFFNEAFIVKEAAYNHTITVKVAGKEIPYSKIESLGMDTISQYLGADVGKEFAAGAENFKQVAETLPLDMQHLLLNLTKNV